MSMQDPIADMLTRIRNAQQRFLKSVSMPGANRFRRHYFQDAGFQGLRGGRLIHAGESRSLRSEGERK